MPEGGQVIVRRNEPYIVGGFVSLMRQKSEYGSFAIGL